MDPIRLFAGLLAFGLVDSPWVSLALVHLWTHELLPLLLSLRLFIPSLLSLHRTPTQHSNIPLKTTDMNIEYQGQDSDHARYRAHAQLLRRLDTIYTL
ncbi:hypothetical protein B0J17DRAFT_719642 [Rhizoctonia solani]|nr:hypothetical protein B0J17DRAFT_719642 [Rhizoctonia solani]